MVFQVHKLGTNYMKWCNSPVDRKLRLFDSNFVEFFTKTPWYMIPAIWLPVIMLLSCLSLNELYTSVSSGGVTRLVSRDTEYFYKIMTTLAAFSVLFGSGIPIWTFLEYVLHRFLFHLEPKDNTPWLITLHFFLHGQHHKVISFFFKYLFQW